jgi:hypothetical protein
LAGTHDAAGDLAYFFTLTTALGFSNGSVFEGPKKKDGGNGRVSTGGGGMTMGLNFEVMVVVLKSNCRPLQSSGCRSEGLGGKRFSSP